MPKQFSLGRQETSKDEGGTVLFYPQTNTGSALPGTATATLHKKDGTSLGSATVDWTDGQISITVPALPYADDYFVRVHYTPSGSSQQATRQIPFDSVHSPWGGTILASYEDITGQHQDIDGILAKLARKNGTTVQAESAYFAHLAHVEIDGWLRQKVQGEGQTRARAIFERDLLHYVEVQLAVSKVYQSITTGEEDSPVESKRKMFWSNARTYFQSIQFSYDLDENGTPDVEKRNPFVFFPIRRR